MNILHIFQDEKFIDFTINLFSSADIQNRFIGLGLKNRPFLPKAFANNPQASVVDLSWLDSSDMREALEWCDCLIVHYLTARSARIIQAAPPNVTVIWSGWGRDYYDLLPLQPVDLFEAETLKFLQNRPLFQRLFKPLEAALRLQVRRLRLLPAVQRVSFFSAPLPSDYDVVRKGLKNNFDARYVQLNYGNISELFDLGPESVNGNNILLGNSATAENNHADVLKLLSCIDVGSRKVIAPLSYGDPSYRDNIIAMGTTLLGKNFQPLTEFIPLETYNNILSSCSTAIMNHKRQQALGNVGTLLQKGVRVYLNPAGPLYDFLKGLGAVVLPTSSLSSLTALPEHPLSEPEKLQTREAIARFWGDDVVRQNFTAFLDAVKAHRGAKNG